MDNKKLFQLATAAYRDDPYSIKQKNGEDIILDGKSRAMALNRSIQAFMYRAAQKVGQTKIQAFSGSSDLATLTKNVFNVTMQVANYDLLWQDAFRGVELQQGELAWEIATVDSGLTFKEIPEGGKIEYAGIGGEKVTVEVVKYGAGLGITWETIEGKKLYRFVEQMEDARSKLYNLWANIHYGLLAAAGLLNQVTWQGIVTDTVLSRDVATLNQGAFELTDGTKDKGYGDTANAQLLIYCNPKIKGRINAALRVTSAEINMGREAGASGTKSAAGIVDYNIEPKYTYNSNIPSTEKALLVLPKNKIQNAAYMQERIMTREEQESLNQLKAVWTAFGATVADTDQVFELAFS